MRWIITFAAGVAALHAQVCVPTRILPVDRAGGTLDTSSCLLSDGTAYAAYRLDLPGRGQIQIGLTAGSSDTRVILQDSTGAQVASGASVQSQVESGSYTLLVNGSPGAYSVSTAFIAEPGMMCTAFPSLGLNQSVVGTLGASGCMTPMAAPYEGYFVTTFGAGTLHVTVTNAAFHASLILRDGDGHLLSSAGTDLVAAVDGDSVYEVVLTGDQTGAYQLSTSFQTDPNETCRVRKALLDANDTDNSSIDGNSCYVTVPGSGDLSYFNYYTINVDAAGLVDLTASSQDFVPTLYLLDDGGNLLTLDSGGGAAPGQSEIRAQVPPGAYVVQVLSPNPSGGVYAFGYQFTAGAPQGCAPSALMPGDVPAGTLSAASCRTPLGLADLYTVNLARAGTLDLTLSAAGFSGVVALRDLKDNLLVQAEDVEGLGVTHLSAGLPAGSYSILATANSGVGTYRLTTAFSAHDLTTCNSNSLDINGGYVQRLGNGSCPDTNGQSVDWYTFTLPVDATVLAVMTSREIAGYLRLVGSDGTVLRSDYDSYSPGEPMFVQFLPAGTYQLAARAASSTIGGYYEVDLRTASGPRPPFCAPAAKLVAGSTINGNLTFTACQYVDGTFADIYEVDLANDATIDVKLSSAEFDAYLVLLDAQGNVVGEDDDSGGGTNAELVQAITAGTYYIVAKPLSNYYNIGSYTLSMATVSAAGQARDLRPRDFVPRPLPNGRGSEGGSGARP